jgi:8-oxo-dGTP pyrophosphatase MutT (NUDIX family)
VLGVSPPYEATSVPVAPASTVMLVEDRPGLQVLMVRRTDRAVFGSSAWVFPGGRVDPADVDAGVVGSGRLPHGFHAAAVRELLEEVGLVFAKADDAWVGPVTNEERWAVTNGRPIDDLLGERGWSVPVDDLHYVAQWITPIGPPRRFDTRFFLAAPPPGDPEHDGSELVEAAWVAPDDAIERFERGDWEVMSPTLRMLRSLARFGSAAEALERAAERRPWQRARVVFDPSGYRVLLPGDADYEHGAEDFERGWVRLY